MDPLLMVGAWAGAILALAGLGRLAWGAFVKAVQSVIEVSISRVWKDMDQIESRLDRLEQQVNELREQVSAMRDLLLAHVAEMTRRHGEN
jgi:cell division protein FtsB